MKSTLTHFTSQSRALCEQLRQIRETALMMEQRAIADSLLVEIDKLAQHRFRIVVLGEFSRGKSTFLNALIGRKLLPAKIRPTTSVLTYVTYGEEANLEVHTTDGHRRTLLEDELTSAITGKGWTEAPVSKVVVREPIGLLDPSIELIDTPGVSDLCEIREDVTLQYLPHADAALFLLDAKACFNESESRFLQRDLLKSNIKRVFFIINKVDQLDPPFDPAQIQKVKQRVHTLVGGMIERPMVHVISAKAILSEVAEHAESPARRHFDDFLSALQTFLIETKGQALTERAAVVGERGIAHLMEGIQLQQTAIHAQAQHSAELLTEAESHSRTAQTTLDERARQWRHTADQIIQTTRAKASAQAKQVGRTLASRLEGRAIPTTNYQAYEAEVHEALREAFSKIAEESQRAIATSIRDAAGSLAQDIHQLHDQLHDQLHEQLNRHPFAQAASSPMFSSSSSFSAPSYSSALLTPQSALVGLGSMGAAALLTSLTGVGVLFVGLIAFIGSRLTESEEEENRNRLARETHRRIESAIEALDVAIAEDGQAFASQAWEAVSEPLQIRLHSTRQSVSEAQSLLGTSIEEREREGQRLTEWGGELIRVRTELRRVIDQLLG